MRFGVAARDPDKPALQDLEKTHGVRRYSCDASQPAVVEQLLLDVVRDIGPPRLIVHNTDGRVAGISARAFPTEPDMVLATLRNSAFSAFLIG